MIAQNDRDLVGPYSLSCYLSAHFGEYDAMVLKTSVTAKAELEICRKHSKEAVFGRVIAPPVSTGFLIALALSPYQLRHGRQPTKYFDADTVLIVDLNEPLDVYIASSFDILFLHISRTALEDIARQTGAAPIVRLSCKPGQNDPVLAGLGRALLPALYCSSKSDTLFIDQLAFALHLHIAQCYGDLVLPDLKARRGLSPLQEKCAKEYLEAQIDEVISISAVAAACGLSRSYFIRSFKESTGKTPYRWLLEYRLSRARSLLAKSGDAIAEIALTCGFADQSHLTRMFTREIGMSPNVWRRSYRI